MKNKIIFYAIIVLLVLFIIARLLSFISGIRPFSLQAATPGEPLIVTRKTDLLLTDISEIASDDDHIYVMFGHYCVVQVYSKSGVYQYTVSFYDNLRGVPSIAADQGRLYIVDKERNVYILCNGSLETFIPKGECTQKQAQEINCKFSANSGKDYTVIGSSVWFAPQGAAQYCVIHRPAYLVLFHKNVSFFFQLFAIIAIGYFIMLIPKKR